MLPSSDVLTSANEIDQVINDFWPTSITCFTIAPGHDWGVLSCVGGATLDLTVSPVPWHDATYTNSTVTNSHSTIPLQ